jgi:hypothetical protein
MWLRWVVACLLISAVPLAAQRRFQSGQFQACSYYGEDVVDDVYSFQSDAEAERLIADVMKHTGLPQNFEVLAANVPNAAAVIQERKRVILYSQSFVSDIVRRTGTEWAATSIMAHEIGHHLSGHTLENTGSRPDLELEADKFSGFTLYKMGGTLEEAKAAMEFAASDRGSSTHPPKSARLAAIHNGWIVASEQGGGPRPSGESPPRESDRRGGGPMEEPDESEEVPVSRPVRRTVASLAGTWVTSAGSLIDFEPMAEGQYWVAEYNLLGPLSQGTATVVDGHVSLQMMSGFIPIACEFTAYGDRMSGNCGGLPLVLERQQ